MLPKNMSKNLPAVVDTNLIIRFLTQDNVGQYKQCRQLLENSKFKSLEIPDLVIAEIIYVLTKVYQQPKNLVISQINSLISLDQIKTNCFIIKTALDLFQKHNISFPDAYLSALVVTGQNCLVYTFDKQLLKINHSKAKSP